MNDKMLDLVDSLVVTSLQLSYENNDTIAYSQEQDYKLLDAIETVLEYYMTIPEYEYWRMKKSSKRETR